MANKTVFFTTDYGKRVILRRVFIPHTYHPEEVLLYTKLLNDFPSYLAKKSLSQLAGAQLSFSCYAYSDGYVIEGKLVQSQSEALHYIFADPYKEAEKIFNDVFTQGYVKGEKNIALAKERLIAESHLKYRSSAFIGQAYLATTYSEIAFEEKFLNEVKADVLESLQKEINKNERGDSFLLGRQEKKGVLELTPTYKEDLVLKEAKLLKNDVTFKYLEDESALFVIKHAEIKTTGMRKTLEHAYAGLKIAIEKHLANLVFIDFTLHAQIIDSTHSLLIITAPNGRLESILNRLPIKLDNPLNIDVLPYFEEAKEDYSIREIKAKMTDEIVLHDLIEQKDLALKEEGDVSLEAYSNLLATFVYEDEVVIRKENYDA